jgi:hypothetical protein
MIKLTPNPEVLAALHKAFPKPAKSAEKSLAKYCKVLGAMLFDALQRGQADDERKLNLYSISTSALANKGGQIGKNRMRVHSWLATNGYPLVQIADKGSNLKGTVSKVKLTKWVTMDDPLAINTQAMTDQQAERVIDIFLAGEEDGNEELFKHLYPELTGGYTMEFVLSLFDLVKIDVQSLRAYVTWVNSPSTKLNISTKKSSTRQARTILAIAENTGGFFLQRRKPSAFGRTYYTGISVQSVPKELRKAMLGNCWEYDMRSSVIAWKMGYAKDWIAQHSAGANVRDEFKATLNYLEDKKDLMHTVQLYTFLEGSNVDHEFQISLLKQAFTAVSFGARLTTKGWQDIEGTWKNPALVSIFWNEDERKRFVNDATVLSFIKEQNKLDDWLFEKVKQDKPELLLDANLQTISGRPSKAKVIAYLYQHNETVAMNLVRDAVVKSGRKVIANIHDAVVIDKRLGAELKSEIEMLLHEKTGNPYWRLGATEYKRYSSIPKDILIDEQMHRERMLEQEAKAQAYQSTFTSVDS